MGFSCLTRFRPCPPGYPSLCIIYSVSGVAFYTNNERGVNKLVMCTRQGSIPVRLVFGRRKQMARDHVNLCRLHFTNTCDQHMIYRSTIGTRTATALRTCRPASAAGVPLSTPTMSGKSRATSTESDTPTPATSPDEDFGGGTHPGWRGMVESKRKTRTPNRHDIQVSFVCEEK